MALSDRVPPPLMKGPRCGVCSLHESLVSEDQATFVEWLDRSRYTAKQILTMLAEEGYVVEGIAESTLAGHRRRECYGRRYGTL